MLLSSLLVCLPMLIMDYNGDGCNESGVCKKSGLLYKFSILNLINSSTDLKVQAGIWLAVSIGLSILFIPLRAYAVSNLFTIDD